MSVIEKAVIDLANALDTLEAKIDGKFDDHAASSDAIVAARRQAQTARTHAETAAQGVGAAISDIKALLDNNPANGKG
ncbi:MAG: hypothetical protein GXP06_12280 [Alphaproteobacteria bacterium]|jgi:cell division septum initiation protein DivIVA|nr:hypothetical protein [Alphaproteobacteria bacterium]